MSVAPDRYGTAEIAEDIIALRRTPARREELVALLAEQSPIYHVGSFAPIRDKFDLAVGFGTTTVNRHSVELLVLDAKCAQVRGFRRVQWDEAEVVVAVSRLCTQLICGVLMC